MGNNNKRWRENKEGEVKKKRKEDACPTLALDAASNYRSPCSFFFSVCVRLFTELPTLLRYFIKFE